MEESRDKLIKTIKEWVKNENELKTLQQEILKRKKEKIIISKDLIDIMKQNQIDCFDINKGKILYNKKNIKKPITKKYLFDVLNKFIPEKSNEINKYILENREITVKENIILKETNK
jgi:hypothetical protein